MSKTILFLLILSFVLTTSCRRKKMESSCCAIPPTEISFEGGYVSIPNIFTPNNDSVFDRFNTQAEGYADFRFEVSKKNGKSLFISEDPNDRWDGLLYEDKKQGFYEKKMKDGTYKFKLEISTNGGERIEKEGEFCLVTGGSARCFYQDEGCVGSSYYDGNYFVPSRELIPESCAY